MKSGNMLASDNSFEEQENLIVFDLLAGMRLCLIYLKNAELEIQTLVNRHGSKKNKEVTEEIIKILSEASRIIQAFVSLGIRFQRSSNFEFNELQRKFSALAGRIENETSDLGEGTRAQSPQNLLKDFKKEIRVDVDKLLDLVDRLQKSIELERIAPTWCTVIGVLIGGVTLVFFMFLVVVSLQGREVPRESRYLVVTVLATGWGLSACLLSLKIAATGKIPLPFAKSHPIQFVATGGFAAAIAIYAIGYLLYIPSANKPSIGDPVKRLLPSR